MRSVGKKILSVILSLLFLTGIVGVGLSENGMLSITAEAASNPYNYYAKDNDGNWANCTWWAWQLAYDNTSVALPTWPDAKYWYDYAKSAGYQCDKNPSPNSIACYNSGYLGHVAFVADVSGNQMYSKEGGYIYSSDGYHEGWVTTSDVDGFIHLTPSHTCDYRASATITKAPTKTATGTRTLYCSCGNTTTQTIPAIPYTTDIPEGIYTITSKCKDGLRLTANCTPNDHAFVWNNPGVDGYWLLRKNNDGTYTLENAYFDNKVLDVQGLNMCDDGIIFFHDYNGGDNQKFYIIPVGDGYYKFVAKHSYLNVNNQGAGTNDGNNITQYRDNGTDAQKWKLQLSNPSLNASTTSVSLKAGENKTVDFTVGRETHEIKLEHVNSNTSVCSATWGSWNGMKNSLTITGKSGGASTLTVYLKDKDTNIVLGTKTISVTVTGNYTLTYNANGGTNPPPSQKGEDNIKLSGAKPTRDGYTFLGWAKSKTATSAQYQPGATFSLTANTTLYAVWKQNPAPVIEIKNFRESRTEAYGASILFTAVTENAPSGSSVHWYYNGEDVGSSATFLMKRADSSYTVQAKLVDSGGNIIAESKQETVNIKTGFFARLIAFFRSLFGLLPYIEQ